MSVRAPEFWLCPSFTHHPQPFDLDLSICKKPGQCAIKAGMSPARKPRRELKKPPLKRMSGEELRAWRIKHDLSQAELAELLGVTQKAISQWELEQRKIPPYLSLVLEYLQEKKYLP